MIIQRGRLICPVVVVKRFATERGCAIPRAPHGAQGVAVKAIAAAAALHVTAEERLFLFLIKQSHQ
jgi:hypothetical protein